MRITNGQNNVSLVFDEIMVSPYHYIQLNRKLECIDTLHEAFNPT